MSNLLKPNASMPIEGLATWTYTVPADGEYSTEVKSTLPMNSALGIIIQSNSINLVSVGGSASNPTPTQKSLSAAAKHLYSASDTISVILSSSSSIDRIPNAVKSIINLYLGV